MRNIFKKAVKLTVIATTLSSVILGTIYGYTAQVSASQFVNPHFTYNDEFVVYEAETEEISEESFEVAAEIETEAASEIETTTEETTTEETTVEETTTEETTVEETTVEETTVEETTEETTEAVTEAIVEETTTQVQTVAATVSYTNVVFKDAYNTYKFDNLEQAKASINVARLTNEEANARAIANKSTYAAQASEVLRLINEYRRANGLNEVSYDDTIATAAMHRAAESAYADWNMTALENGTTKRHIRPTFEKASSIRDYYGLTGNFGENFGRFQENAQEIFDGWKNSSSHNSLMLGAGYERCGIGVAQDSEGYYYWVAIFM